MRRWGGALLVVVSVAALAGCAVQAAPLPTPGTTSTYVAPPPLSTAPLTGEVVDAALTTPAIAAKVDNHPAARPQFGLERTDIVFEELVEGGLTRYVAIWQSDVPDEIGPVRSIRPMDPDIISSFGGIVAYSGGQARFVDMMQQTNVVNLVHGYGETDALFYRTDLKDSPHDVIVKAAQAVAQRAELGPPPQQFAFSADLASSTAAREGARVDAINLGFSASSTPSWLWDAGRAAYLRSQDGEPDLDQAGAQLSATNVVVLRVPISWGYGVPMTELIGGGEASVSSGGATVTAMWQKPDRGATIRLTDGFGVPVRLAPGNTWIELVPTDGWAELVAAPPPADAPPTP